MTRRDETLGRKQMMTHPRIAARTECETRPTRITAFGVVPNAVISDRGVNRGSRIHCPDLLARAAWRFCFSTSANCSTRSACARLLSAWLRFV